MIPISIQMPFLLIFATESIDMKRLLAASILILAMSCTGGYRQQSDTTCRYASHFDIVKVDSAEAVVTISPYDGDRDTLKIDGPVDNIICMSTSHIACLSEIGADSVITAVSGLGYVADPDILRRRDIGKEGVKPIYDIGNEASLDYEKIVTLGPDLVVAYTVSSAEPPYISKLRSLGVQVLVLHDHMENHPLARAEYIRLFGVLTGREQAADSIFNEIAARYESLASGVSVAQPWKVLINIPYADAWYIPGQDNYMSRLIQDAGGEVLGSLQGRSSSSVISLEDAWRLSQEADIWLNPGHCDSRSKLASIHQLFPSFGPLQEELPIYNNTLRTTPEGGNDFFESGAVRPDLILEDLIYIMSERSDKALHYFKLLR